MADASVDIVWRGRGLTGADRQTEKLATTVDKVDRRTKKVAATQKTAAVAWERDERRKQIATRTTQQFVEKLDRAEAIAAVRRDRRQRFFQGAGKVGGAAGAVAGAVAEGATGGIAGLAFSVIGASLGAAFVILQNESRKTAESLARISSTTNQFNSELRAGLGARSQRGLALGLSQADARLQVAGRFGRQADQVLLDSQNIQKGFFQAMLAAKKAGVFEQFSIREVSKFIGEGRELGEGAGVVVGRLTALTPAQRSAAVGSRRGRAAALGHGTDFQARQALERVRTGTFTAEAGIGASQAARAAQDEVRRAERDIFLAGKTEVVLRNDLINLLLPEVAARQKLNKTIDEQILKQQQLTEAASLFTETIFTVIQGITGGAVESQAAESLRIQEELLELQSRINLGGN